MVDKKLLDDGPEWTFDLIDQYHKVIAATAEKFKLTTYPNQIEIITAEQMMDAYSSVGMPIGYNHWSFGKKFIQTEQNYKRGQMGLAYEIVINSDPCIAYLMEENTLAMQALVMAHASYGHNSFFKNNYLFKTWTDASSIIDYLVFAKNYVADCEKRHGIEAVEDILDACHALMNQGVDRYKRPAPLSLTQEKERQEARLQYLQAQVNELWRTIPKSDSERAKEGFRFPSEPQENILYFLEKKSPLLETWQRELIRIVRKISQYFYPQRQTQVMNEGWATFWHYTILNDMYDQGYVTDRFMLEFLHSHTNVVMQPPYNSPYFNGINPYALGFAMMSDIRRICTSPTEEDKYWFKDIAGSDWLETLHFAMENFKDESFISQFLSPKLIRDFKLFNLTDHQEMPYLEIDAIHNDAGYQTLRQALSSQYNISSIDPNIQIHSVDIRGDRSMTLRYIPHNHIPLAQNLDEMLRYIYRLWGFKIRLEQEMSNGEIKTLAICPSE